MENENSRVVLSFGLITFYLATVNLLSTPNIDNVYWTKTIKDALLCAWGISTFLLLLFIFIYALSLKYKSSNKLELMGYKFSISITLKEIFFDLGVEYYLTGLFAYFLYNIPFYLIEKKVNPIVSFVFFFIILLIISFFLLIAEKRSSKHK